MVSEKKENVLEVERVRSNGSEDLKVGPTYQKKDYSGAHEASLFRKNFVFQKHY